MRQGCTRARKRFDHVHPSLEDLAVGEADRVHAGRVHEPLAFRVVLSAASMDLAVDLHHQPQRWTVEVHDEARDDVLPAEAKAQQAAPS